ncbi:MAG TPA: hypothetical protein GX004_09065, partial [Firmicutes bacterium]|nr:hypothetical protein [Bacillota bacterium]
MLYTTSTRMKKTDNKNNDRLALYGLLSSLGLSPAMRNDQAILEALEKGEPVDHI